ncbi:MAG: hypothetical protein Q8K78_14335 [Planctomycetaceae bacterium]|nr:hypothetical protein [Planctomycetaceae bacterium]
MVELILGNHAHPFALSMTDDQREAQLVDRVFGNIHLECPGVTRELIRDLLARRKAEHTDAAVR